MSQDVGQRLKIKIQRLKIKIQCLKIKTKKGLLMVWWCPLPSPASQQPASLEASRPELAPPSQPWPAWRPAPTASRPEVAPPPKPSHPAHWPRPPSPGSRPVIGCRLWPGLGRAHDVTGRPPPPRGRVGDPPGAPMGPGREGGPWGPS